MKSNIYEKYVKEFDFKKIFLPTLTSKLLVNAASKYANNKKKILDLGCGGGIITACIYKKNYRQKFYLSDLSENAVKKAIKNLKKINITKNVTFKVGNGFKPWNFMKFDLIVNDISGVSKTVSKISPWFKDAPTDTSEKGIELLKIIVNESSYHMSDNAIFITPIISLSDVKSALKIIKAKLKIISVEKNEWPLPSIMKKNIKLLKNLKKKNCINFEEKYGSIVCYTLILVCKKKW